MKGNASNLVLVLHNNVPDSVSARLPNSHGVVVAPRCQHRPVRREAQNIRIVRVAEADNLVELQAGPATSEASPMKIDRNELELHGSGSGVDI